MFYFMEDFEIANYADNLTPFSAKLNHKLVVEELETSSSVLFTLLQNNKEGQYWQESSFPIWQY